MQFAISDLLQLVVGLSILIVWIWRSTKPSAYRVGGAQTLAEEFTEAGVPEWVYDVLRILKPIFAFLLVIGIVYKPFFFPCLTFTTLVMMGAVGAHLKVRDSFMKWWPAATLLLFCVIIFTCPTKW